MRKCCALLVALSGFSSANATDFDLDISQLSFSSFPGEFHTQLLSVTTPVLAGHFTATIAGDLSASTLISPNTIDVFPPNSPIILAIHLIARANQPIGQFQETLFLNALQFFIRGDANNDLNVDLSDAVYTLNSLFLGGNESPCLDAADADDSGFLNLTDPIYTLNTLFIGGPEIPTPSFESPGIDPTEDTLACGSPLLTTIPISIDITPLEPGAIHTGFSIPTSDRVIPEQPPTLPYVADELLILSRDFDSTEAELLSLANHLGAIIVGADTSLAIYQFRIPEAAPEALTALEAEAQNFDPKILAMRHWVFDESDAAIPNDAHYKNLSWSDCTSIDQNAANYPFLLIDAPRAWDITTGSPTTEIAIVDSGFYPEHQDLRDNIRTGTFFDPDGKDIYGFRDHGSYVAGIAAARGNNNLGVAGLCWNCGLRLYNISFYADDPIEGVRLATDPYHAVAMLGKAVRDGVHIINYSQASHSPAKYLYRQVFRYAEKLTRESEDKRGVVFVIAAGNSFIDIGKNEAMPASLSNEFDTLITVASVNANGELSRFTSDVGCTPDPDNPGSNYGAPVMVAAPGTNIGTTHGQQQCAETPKWKPDCIDTLATTCGTSMAAPFVSGLAALLWSKEPDITAVDVIQRIIQGAVQGDKKVLPTRLDDGTTITHDFYIINALHTLLQATPPPPPDPDSLIWKRASGNCSDFVDTQGHVWHEPCFDDSTWQQVPLPDSFNNSGSFDRFYRTSFTLDTITTVKLELASDDGLWLFINGQFVLHRGGFCNQVGCVNGPGCAKSCRLPATDITRFLHPGENTVAVHASDASCCNMYFRASLSILPNAQPLTQGYALQFDGASRDCTPTHVQIPYSEDLQLVTWTIQGWFYAQGDDPVEERPGAILSRFVPCINGGCGYLNYEIAYGKSGAPRRLILYWDNRRNGHYELVSEGPEILPYDWHHFTGTYDGLNLKLYVDGQFNASIPASGEIQTGRVPVIIGEGWHGQFHGVADEIRIWNRALSVQETQDTWNKRLTDIDAAERAGLVAYYQFEEGMGQTVRDQTSHNNDGFLGKTETQPDDSDPAWVGGKQLAE